MFRQQDVSTSESLRARRTRLLAFLSFMFSIHKIAGTYVINGVEFPEDMLLSRNRLSMII